MKESIAICTAAGIDIRSLGPAEVVMLAGETSDRKLQDRACFYRVPASQGARERIATWMAKSEYERTVTTDEESAQRLKDLLELGEVPNYGKALASMTKAELSALRARVGK